MLKILIQAGCVFAVVCVVALSLPQSRLREFLRPIVLAGIAVASGIYVLSPVDAVPELVTGPFGLIDDAGALVGGIAAGRAAMRGFRPSAN
ncbi:DUF1232 domain-containing protein [Tautonia marina]|uniref:DUF1232 domain-containing protein n=1 Tax=Tautonia marina TaxID=2653855 RepID=UPI0012609626|nr:YkvA family protein [Tautonia marina]